MLDTGYLGGGCGCWVFGVCGVGWWGGGGGLGWWVGGFVGG